MNKSTVIWMSIAMFFMGIVIGFVLAPIKNGVYCGNHNTNCGSGNSVENNENGKNLKHRIKKNLKAKEI